MSYIYEMYCRKNTCHSFKDADSPYLDYVLKLKRQLDDNLPKNFKDMFKLFCLNIDDHMLFVRDEECSHAMFVGMKIGMEYAFDKVNQEL